MYRLESTAYKWYEADGETVLFLSAPKQTCLLLGTLGGLLDYFNTESPRKLFSLQELNRFLPNSEILSESLLEQLVELKILSETT